MPQSNDDIMILSELRLKDYDRYALCLFAPPAYRTDLAALFLFNAELGQIRDQVTEPLFGKIRLQWWRDGLTNLGMATQPPHILLHRLAEWQKRGIDLSPLHSMLDARETDLLPLPFSDAAAYTSYRTATSHPLGRIAAALLGQMQHAELYQQAMQHYTTIGLQRAIPHWLRRRQMPLPEEWLRHNDINATEFAELRPQPGLCVWGLETAKATRQAIKQLRHKIRALPAAERQAARAIWLHQELAAWYAGQIIRAGGDLFSPRLHKPSPQRLIYLLWRSLMI